MDTSRQEIGARLRKERERLGMNQEVFAELGGVKKRAQVTYESGERVPDAEYLKGLQHAGVDVAFVVGGQRVVVEAKAGASSGVQVNSNVTAYTAPIRDAIWLEALEAVIDWLNARGKRVPGHKVIAATDLIADYCRERGMDEAVVERTLRLVA